MCAFLRKNIQMRDWPMPPPMVKGSCSSITAFWKGSCARSGQPAFQICRVDMSADAAEDEGMVCGGVVEVMMELV